MFWLEYEGLLNAPAVHFIVWTRLSQTQFVRACFACTVASTPHLYTWCVPKSNFSSGLINELNFGVGQALIQGLSVKIPDRRQKGRRSFGQVQLKLASFGLYNFLCSHTIGTLYPLCSYCIIFSVTFLLFILDSSWQDKHGLKNMHISPSVFASFSNWGSVDPTKCLVVWWWWWWGGWDERTDGLQNFFLHDWWSNCLR